MGPRLSAGRRSSNPAAPPVARQFPGLGVELVSSGGLAGGHHHTEHRLWSGAGAGALGCLVWWHRDRLDHRWLTVRKAFSPAALTSARRSTRVEVLFIDEWRQRHLGDTQRYGSLLLISGLGAELVFSGGRTSLTSILSGGVEVVSHGGLCGVDDGGQRRHLILPRPDWFFPGPGGAARRARASSAVVRRKRSSPAVPTLALRSTVAACSLSSPAAQALAQRPRRRRARCWLLHQRRCFVRRRDGYQNNGGSRRYIGRFLWRQGYWHVDHVRWRGGRFLWRHPE